MEALFGFLVLLVPFAVGYYLGRLRTKIAYYERNESTNTSKVPAPKWRGHKTPAPAKKGAK